MDNRVPATLLVLAILSLHSLRLFSQAGVSATGKPVAELVQEPPQPMSATLSFGKSERIPVSLSDQGLMLPLHCDPDGSIAFESVNFGPPGAPPGQSGFSIYVVRSPENITRFNFENVGLKKLLPVQTFAVTGDGTYAIVKAVTTEEDLRDKDAITHPFLVRFDHSGFFKGSRAIDGIADISSMGCFPAVRSLLRRPTLRTISCAGWCLMRMEGCSAR